MIERKSVHCRRSLAYVCPRNPGGHAHSPFTGLQGTSSVQLHFSLHSEPHVPLGHSVTKHHRRKVSFGKSHGSQLKHLFESKGFSEFRVPATFFAFAMMHFRPIMQSRKFPDNKCVLFFFFVKSMYKHVRWKGEKKWAASNHRFQKSEQTPFAWNLFARVLATEEGRSVSSSVKFILSVAEFRVFLPSITMTRRIFVRK